MTCNILGRYNGTSKNGKPYSILYYSAKDEKLAFGYRAGSVLTNPNYADKIETHTACGGISFLGFNNGKPFIYVK